MADRSKRKRRVFTVWTGRRPSQMVRNTHRPAQEIHTDQLAQSPRRLDHHRHLLGKSTTQM